jgi:hypothetical protein
MAYILDSRGTGGAIITLGETLTFPVAFGRPELDAQPPVGSLRYNPETTELELYRSDGLGGHEWRIVERISLDTSTILPKTGGTVLGNMTMTGDSRIFLPSGSISAPSLSFVGATQTGFSTDENNVLLTSVNGVQVAKFDINLATLNVPMQATTATFETITAATLNVARLNTYLPREISGFFPGPFEAGQVIFRQVIAHRVLISDGWGGSVAFVQGMPLGIGGASFRIDKISSNIRTTIGVLSFAAVSVFGTFWSPPGGEFQLDGGDIIEIVVAQPDVITGLSFSLLTRVPVSVNVAPTDISISPSVVEERARPGTVVGIISVSDTDSTTFNYQMLDSADDRFAIIGNQIVVGDNLLDWSINSSHSIRIRAIDEDGLAYDKTFSITVRNIVDMSAYDPIRPVVSTSTVDALATLTSAQSIGLTTWEASAAAIASVSASIQLPPISAASLGIALVSTAITQDAGDVTSIASVSDIVMMTGNMTTTNISAESEANIYVEMNAIETLENFDGDGESDAIVEADTVTLISGVGTNGLAELPT